MITKRTVKEYAIITVGTIIIAAAVYFFMLPSHVTVGSASALALVISVLGTYFGGIMLDHFIFGLNLKRRVCILSPKEEEITRYILHELHSGATIYEAIGAYDNKVRREIVTIVDKLEYRRLMDYVRRTDPKAFITVYSVNEISYQPKQ